MKDKANDKRRAAREEIKLDEFLLEDDGMFDDEDDDSVTDDTLEFLSLDDEAIEAYQSEHKKTPAAKKASAYEEDDDEDDDYEDEEYDYEDDGDEEYEYDDDDYDEDEYDEYDDEGGLIVRFRRFLTEMSTLDMVVAVLGVVVIVGALTTGVLYANAKTIEKQVEAFASVGEEIEGISIIGESGLVAVSESAKITDMVEVEEEKEEEVVEEEEIKQTIEVTLNLTSIQSDLKIKFVNKATGKLIGGVPFEVEVSNGKKTFGLKDEDKDGIIYQTGIDNGTYQVSIKPFTGNDYAQYKLPASSSSVKVTDTIAYKKVDVADEVKTESEINAAKEDTAAQNTAIESALTDTVEWVESTKTPIGDGAEVYEEVPKSNIPDPWTLGSTYRKLVEEEAEDYENISVSLSSESLTLNKGESAKLNVTVSGSSDRYIVEWSSADPAIATVSEGTVKAVGVGSTTVTANVSVGSMIQELSCEVTVVEEQSDNKDNGNEGGENNNNNNSDTVYTKVNISGATEVFVGKTITLTAQTEPQGGSIKWSSDNEKVAKVDNQGVVTGVAEGKATIKALCSEAEDVSATCTVTVKKETTVDGGAKLKDKDGNQMYYKDGAGEYKEATYNDYNKYDQFYKKSAKVSEYRYTGWQTIDGAVYFFDKNGNYVTGEQVIQGAKYTFGSDGKLSSGSGTMGIDVSKHNGNIDWNAVKNSGVSFVIIRCGYRGSATGVLVEDPKFRSNIKGAKAAGLKVGVYFFSQAVNEVEAIEEASMAVSLVSGYGLDMPIFLDVESAGGRADGISKDARTAVCRAFCQTVQNSGYSAGIYANKTWFNEKINTSSLTSYKIWLAQYASAPTYTATRYDMWQYSSKGRISGISGDVDLDIRYY
ncbi:MAG: Ig-like domain-containing protein [Lachnospiraceae bacterium]|nr:Ig-like domain-containing protein [Lachnospiraceae bacterium]